MDYKAVYYPESRFGGFSNIDGTIAFYLRVNALVGPWSTVLDVGCGRGSHGEDPIPLRRELRILKGRCKKVIGIDVDESARQNPFLDEFRLTEGRKWPLEDESVDVCICDSVLEHIADPDAFFAECQRVLRPAGYLCIRTPNVLSYVGLASKIIPNRFHAAVAAKVQGARKQEDVFPTRYACNTKWKLRRLLCK